MPVSSNTAKKMAVVVTLWHWRVDNASVVVVFVKCFNLSFPKGTTYVWWEARMAGSSMSNIRKRRFDTIKNLE